MSMGHSACFAEVISVENLKTLLPETWEKFEKTCEKMVDGGWESVVQLRSNDSESEFDLELDIEDTEENQKIVDSVLKELMDKFEQETGLSLDLRYHNSQEYGDRYDECDGAFFHVCGCYVKSHALESLEKKLGENTIERQFYVVYG